MNKLKNIIFWLMFILYMELLFKIAAFKQFFSINLLYLLLFLVPIAVVFHLITGLFNDKINKFLSYVFIILFTIIYVAQLVYYKTYLSIFSVYSMGKAGQLLEYVDTIIKIIIRNGFFILLMLLPLILFIIFNKRFLNFHRYPLKYIAVIFVFGVFFHVTGILSMNIDKNSEYSANSLYFDAHSPTLTTTKMGLLTMMRLDVKRLVFGFSEKSRLTETLKTKKVIAAPKKIEYNKMDINFDELNNGEQNKVIIDMNNYFKIRPATNKNQYTGMFKGKNLITILGESFYPLAVDKDLTPTLYKLVHEGFVFNNFYNPLFPVSTSDGEYMTITSLIPKEGVWSTYKSYDNDMPFVLGNAFKNIGYKTTAYHNNLASYYKRNKSIPNFGYDYYACGRGLNINCKQWPESDLEMVDATYDQYMNNQPFLTYYITVSGHLRYNTYNSMSRKHWDAVKDLPYSNAVKAYLACNMELDKALEQLIKYLDEKGILKDTVIELNGDHYPYGLTLNEINEKMDPDLDDNFEKHRSHLIIWNSEMKKVEIDKLGSTIDVLPTLLNLFGVEYDSRLLMGNDLLSDMDPIVIFSNRSWITEKGRYNAITGTFEGKQIDDSYIKNINAEIYNRYYLSKQIFDQDYYRGIFK